MRQLQFKKKKGREFNLIKLTAQRKPEPGMESKPSSSLVMEIM